MYSLETRNIDVAYEGHKIIEEMNLLIPKGQITVIIGPNGCGKSTLLKALARIIKPVSGEIILNDLALSKQTTKEVAKQMAILPQSPEAPNGMTVEELIAYGRYPHQSGFGRLQEADKKVIDWALEATGITALRNCSLDALSGGQRQRVWIALAVAQETDLILLDEPTTYLDLAHQLEVLQLLHALNQEEERTIVMVLHDLNLAARFADNMIAMKDGQIVKYGPANDVMEKEVLREVFNIDGEIVADPRTGKNICITYDLL
ncbi:ABC transporter ATP-binding protein [Culicoidibacter larvae]|uniref:ABC transporter ATP-binding protein n=1 Tax=Culicoidibacter larvae TaxID=2579976 RepID=A0A5R8QH91_9FIRM|nr:ABC transporter ATP-binding protein [Culicoidibacter larvae]TLG77070.1 ABC transporter ATP-binding protein [Culicoidibacter larvae]